MTVSTELRCKFGFSSMKLFPTHCLADFLHLKMECSTYHKPRCYGIDGGKQVE